MGIAVRWLALNFLCLRRALRKDITISLDAAAMSKKTVTNEPYRGLVEALSIPVEIHTRAGGESYASVGGVLPIHCASPEQVKELSATTHHYCDIFTEQLFAPLGELAYVRLDDNYAEKVFINRAKRILIVSSDGALAQWRAAPTFESANHFIAGTPIVNRDGSLVSVVTARQGNHYAVSTFEGDGGYFESPHPWKMLQTPEGHLCYADRTFPTREDLRAYIATLPPAEVSPSCPPRPSLQWGGRGARVALVAASGRQMAHLMLHNVSVAAVQYL